MKKNIKLEKKWLIPVIAAVLVVAGVLVMLFTGVFGDAKTPVPDIVNMSMEEAQKILEEAGLSLCVSQKEINNEVAENTILKQSPASGEKVAEGSVINVTISEKSVEVEVPDVENYNKDLAIEVLQNAGFKVEIIEEKTDEYANGSVIKQSHKGKGQTGSTITITVSKNNKPETDKMIKVPSVLGKTLTEAKEILKDKFYIAVVKEEFSDDVKKGAIIAQTPVADVQAKENTTITVIISKGKASDVKITMPSVVFSTRTQAKETLEKLGLKVAVREEFSDTVAAGLVISQSIKKGEVVKADSSVVITVSKGKQQGSDKTTGETVMPTKFETNRNPETTTKKQDSNVTVPQKPTVPPAKPSEPTELSGESRFVSKFKVTTDKSTASAGDIITVSVKLKTNYNIVSVSLPVVYDARVFEVVGTSETQLSSYLNFTGTLTENAYSTNGNWKSPENMYKKTSNPDYWTSEKTMRNYKIAFATWVAMPSQGTVLTTLGEEETIVTFKLRVKENVSDTSGRIFLSNDFIKTAKEPQGILSVGRATSDTISVNSIVATGQTIDLRDATTMVTIK